MVSDLPIIGPFELFKDNAGTAIISTCLMPDRRTFEISRNRQSVVSRVRAVIQRLRGNDRSLLIGDRPMKKLIFAILLIASPAWAQTKLSPKNTTTRVDNCAPIGRTANGTLVYSMKCDNMPVPPPPQAEAAPAPEEPAVQRTGIFGMSSATPGAPQLSAAPAAR